MVPSIYDIFMYIYKYERVLGLQCAKIARYVSKLPTLHVLHTNAFHLSQRHTERHQNGGYKDQGTQTAGNEKEGTGSLGVGRSAGDGTAVTVTPRKRSHAAYMIDNGL